MRLSMCRPWSRNGAKVGSVEPGGRLMTIVLPGDNTIGFWVTVAGGALLVVMTPELVVPVVEVSEAVSMTS